jgi:hypothetical protein
MELYAVVASQKEIDDARIAEMLRSQGYTLISKGPVEEYTAPNVQLWIIAECLEFSSEFECYYAYRVLGPVRRLPKLVFIDVPFWVKIRYIAAYWPIYIRELLKGTGQQRDE